MLVADPCFSLALLADISMSETLLRQHEILLNVPLPPIGSAIDKLKDQAIRKESRRLAQIASSRSHHVSSTPSTSDPLDASLVDDSLTTSSTSTKRKDPPSPPASGTSTPTGNGEERSSKQQREQEKPRRKGDPVPFGTVLGKPIEAARGHTSYLTFATLLPVGLRGGKEGVVEEDGEEGEMEGEEDGELDAGESLSRVPRFVFLPRWNDEHADLFRLCSYRRGLCFSQLSQN